MEFKTHRYSKEYYESRKDVIREIKKKYYQKHCNEIKRKKKEKYKLLKSANKEDIERNQKLISEGKELDMPLKKLGPIFKSKILMPSYSYNIKIRYCVLCKKQLFNKEKKYCPDCKIKHNREYKREYRKHYHQHYHKKRMKRDGSYVIKTRLRDRLRDAIRHYNKTGKIRKTGEYLNYDEIIKHLGPCPGERKDYHIDHIVPLYKFNFKDDEEIKKAFRPENLQWLKASENLKKGRKINRKTCVTTL